jgi:putative DNA primase/helicase
VSAEDIRQAATKATMLELVDAAPPAFSDESLALQFAARYADTLRHIGTWGKWYRFDGCKWRQDETYRALDRARTVCRAVSANIPNENLARSIASAKTVAAVERLAKADIRLAATVDQWDASDWLINTPEIKHDD